MNFEPNSNKNVELVARESMGNIRAAQAATQMIGRLTNNDIGELTRFARARMIRLGLCPTDADDVFQSAVAATLMGAQTPDQGRHPAEADLVGHPQFCKYLRGVICSITTQLCRRRRLLSIVPIDDELDRLKSADSASVTFDFAGLFFSRLLQRAPRTIRPLIEDWSRRWGECDSIPIARQHRRQRQRIRRLAISVARDLYQTTHE
ncbi:MAG: hypothetical protein QM813_03175 [Verrucomicrobiota bacterium]